MMVSMSKTNFEENKKTISNFVIQNKGGFLICSEENIVAIKPKCFDYNFEVSQFKILNLNILESENTYNKDKVSMTNREYKIKRQELILLIQRKTTMFNYKLKTFYLAVSILDQIMSIENTYNLECEIVALVSLLLAIKYDENDAIIPDLNDLGFINYKNFYTVDDIRRYEVICLHVINYNIIVNTPFFFIYNLCLNGIIFSDECIFDKNNQIILNCKLSAGLESPLKINCLDKLYKLCYDILEVVIFNSNYKSFSPFKIACSVISLVRELYGFKNWTERLEHIYSIKFDMELIKCYEFIKSLFLSKPSVKFERISINTPLLNVCKTTRSEKKEKHNNKLISEKIKEINIYDANKHRNKTIIKDSHKSSKRNIKETSFNYNKNTLVDTNNKDRVIKNLKNHLMITDQKSVDDTNNKNTINQKANKVKYYSEVFPFKSKNKNLQSVKRLNINTTKTNFSKETISHNLKNTLINKKKVTSTFTKKNIKSKLFMESFKNLESKNQLKSIQPISQLNNIHVISNSVEKFSIDTGNVINSTKSNSFASSFSNSNTLSNSLKHINLKAQFSSINTESTLSSSSFIQTKDLKTKFRNINLDKVITSSACNVEICLNTHSNRNKKFVSSLNSQEAKKTNIIDNRMKSVNKVLTKK